MPSHKAADIAKDLEPLLEQLRDIKYEAARSNYQGHAYDTALGMIAERLCQSTLEPEASEFVPSYRDSRTRIEQFLPGHVERLRVIIDSLQKNPKIWEAKIRAARPPATTPTRRGAAYVNVKKIAELEALPKSKKWDQGRLIQLCRELNTAHQQGAVLAVAMLVRAIMDHTAKLFGDADFQKAASRAPQPAKNAMTALAAAKYISHRALHVQIGPKALIPTPQQVDVKNHLDVLIEQATLILEKDSE
jgi:hypothetical protein